MLIWLLIDKVAHDVCNEFPPDRISGVHVAVVIFQSWNAGGIFTVQVIETLTSFSCSRNFMCGAEDVCQLMDNHSHVIIGAIKLLWRIGADQ